MEKARSIREIIKVAGGGPAIIAAITEHGDKLGVDAVYKWPQNGIPDRYWRPIISLVAETEHHPVTAEELLRANEIARSEKAA